MTLFYMDLPDQQRAGQVFNSEIPLFKTLFQVLILKMLGRLLSTEIDLSNKLNSTLYSVIS